MPKKIYNFDIYKIDNFLIKFGYILSIAIIIIFIRSILPELDHLWETEKFTKLLILIFLFIGSIIMLKYGYYFRKKEHIINAILRQLDQAIEVSAKELLENTGYTTAQLEESLQIINKNGLGYYVWNKDSGIISDGRLRRRMVHVDNCPSCGNRIGKQYPIAMDEIPTCPSCGTTLDINQWNELKYREFQNIENDNVSNYQREQLDKSKISLPILILLIILFWPGAIIYVLLKSKRSRQNGFVKLN